MKDLGTIHLAPGGGIVFTSSDGNRSAQYMFEPDKFDTETLEEDRRCISISYFDRQRPDSFHEEDDESIEPSDYQDAIKRACDGELRAFLLEDNDDLVVDFHTWGLEVWNKTAECTMAAVSFTADSIGNRPTSTAAELTVYNDEGNITITCMNWEQVVDTMAKNGIDLRIASTRPMPKFSL